IYDQPYCTMVGTEVDRLLTAELFEYFADLGKVLAEKSSRERRRVYGYVKRGYTNSFLLGYQQTLCQRLEAAHRAAMEQTSSSSAMVYIGNKLAESKKHAAENLNFRTAK